MLDRNTITSVHWQMQRDQDGAAVFGEIAAEFDDLHQEIRQCILTPKGSVPLNPEKGCDIEPYKDRPMNVRHMFVAAEVREALRLWVPRIDISDVSVQSSFAQILISVTWRPKETVLAEFETTEVIYAL